MKKELSLLSCMIVILIYSCHIPQTNSLNSKEELGHYLFFENRISINHTKSCASCHNPEFAFTDGYRRSVTSTGENVAHNSPSLINVCLFHYFDWANPTATSLAKQIKRPLYNQTPMELGLDQHLTELQTFFKKDSLYSSLFKKAYPLSDSLFTLSQIEESIVAYESRLISNHSAFDENKMSESAQRGFQLFKSDKLKCAKCHVPPSFTLASISQNMDSVYANIGLYNVNCTNQYPTEDEGLSIHTKKMSDQGKFKIPSLRNVMLTQPYMHDGSINTIEEVIEMYKRGGRNITYGDYQGDGALNKNKSSLIQGFSLSNDQQQDLINFLHALSDTSIKSNPIFQYPFEFKTSSNK